MIGVVIFLILHWYLSLAVQTLFHHRYASHGYYQLSKFEEKLGYILTFLFQGSSYLSPYAYGIMHKAHHSYSDTEKDPHSPVFHKDPVTMMMKTADTYMEIYEDDHKLNNVFKPHVARWDSFDRFASSWPARISMGAVYFFIYVLIDPPMWMYLFLPVHFLMGPIHGLIVNWFGHKAGYRNFNTPDQSANTLAMDFLMMGELYQNNHHAKPNDMHFAKKWWEFDPGYMVLNAYLSVRNLFFPSISVKA